MGGGDGEKAGFNLGGLFGKWFQSPGDDVLAGGDAAQLATGATTAS